MTVQKSKFIILALTLIMGLVAISTHAMADPGKGKHKHGHKHKHEQVYHDHGDTIIISTHDRVIIRDYIAQDYRSHCPPGLAKKHNGCLPPGHAKKYHVGQVLPPGIYIPVSGDLIGMLSPAPRGYQYVQVDKDVLLISEASKKVIDAVTLLSAVGN